MKILAIEASGPVAGCALLEDGTLTAEYSVQYKKKHSQSLVPMLNEMKEMLDLDLSSIDFIAVTAGPGSFTGLAGPHSGFPCVRPLWNRPRDLPAHGRKKTAGLHRDL